jgi:hypothetical protein
MEHLLKQLIIGLVERAMVITRLRYSFNQTGKSIPVTLLRYSFALLVYRFVKIAAALRAA